MSVVILGDVHLGRSVSIGKVGIGSALNSRVIDQVNLLDWTLEQANDCNATDIIVTGDVFEEPKPHYSLIALFVAWLRRCHICGIRVHVIMGNHDFLRTGNHYTSSLDIISECDLENVSIYRDINTIFIDDVAFTLIPFRDRKSYNVEANAEALAIFKNTLVYELAAIPIECDKVLVGHLAIEGSIPVGDEIDDLANELFCPIDMFTGYNYVWMGHIHKPQVMANGSVSRPHVAHIGSMDISNFGETDHKKHIIIFDSENNPKFETRPLPTRPLKKIEISVPKDTKDTTQFVLDEIEKEKVDLAKAIVRLEVHLVSHELLPINRGTVEKFIYSLGAHNVSGISESKKLAPIKKDATAVIDTTMDVIAAIKLFSLSQVDKDNQSAFIELAAEIYNEYKDESKE